MTPSDVFPDSDVQQVDASGAGSRRLVHAAAFLFPIFLLPLMLTVSKDYGATWDEELQQHRGETLVAYYTGRVGDLSVPDDGAHLYGAPFDVLAVGLQRLVPADTYVVRHLLNAAVGWLGIVLCGVLAGRLFGPGTALLAMVLLATTPRYFGHSMNNSKDIPFATLATIVLYALCRLCTSYPFFTWRSAVAMALAIGLALNIRPGALLFLVYLCVLLFYQLQAQRLVKIKPMLVTAAWVGGIAAVTLAIGSVFWPWALERPLIGPVLGLAQLSRFGWNHSFLFNSQDVFALEPRWDYVPRWLALTLPVTVLAGILLSIARAWCAPALREKTIALWAVVLFPLVYVIGMRATLYDEVRHLLFVFAPIAVLAASGWMMALKARRATLRIAAVTLLIIGLARTVAFQIREHPNQVVYFNELAGGPGGAYGRYEMDYWGNCMLQALGQVDALAPSRQPRVTVSGWPVNVLHMDAPRYPRVQVTDPGAGSHQLTVVLSRGSRAHVMELARRRDVLARIATTDGALLCAVLRGPAYETLFRDGQQAGTHPGNVDAR